jgi:hypothetical protein
LQSIIFNYSIILKKYEDAYSSIINNPDKLKKNSDLRRFINEVINNNRFEILYRYPFTNMINQVDDVLFSKAKTSNMNIDINETNFYEILYSFHCLKGNYIRASTVMYNCAKRMSNEINSKEQLERQITCYISALNSLKMVSKETQYILSTITNQNDGSPKHKKVKIYEESENEEIDIIKIEQIEREYLLAKSILQIYKNFNFENNLKAEDVVLFLIEEGTIYINFRVL